MGSRIIGRDPLRCLRCCKPVEGEMMITSCGHVFCMVDANQWFVVKSDCPACGKLLTKRDIRKTILEPTGSDVHMIMWGWPPEVVLACASSAVICWGHLQHEQSVFQGKQREMQVAQASDDSARKSEALRAAQEAVTELQARLEAEMTNARRLAKVNQTLQEEVREAERKCRNFEHLYQETRTGMARAGPAPGSDRDDGRGGGSARAPLVAGPGGLHLPGGSGGPGHGPALAPPGTPRTPGSRFALMSPSSAGGLRLASAVPGVGVPAPSGAPGGGGTTPRGVGGIVVPGMAGVGYGTPGGGYPQARRPGAATAVPPLAVGDFRGEQSSGNVGAGSGGGRREHASQILGATMRALDFASFALPSKRSQ